MVAVVQGNGIDDSGGGSFGLWLSIVGRERRERVRCVSERSCAASRMEGREGGGVSNQNPRYVTY